MTPRLPLLAVTAAALSFALTAPAQAVVLQPLERVSVADDEQQAQCLWESCQVTRLQVSPDEQVVFFKTDLSLAASDTEADADTYARDLRTGRTTLLPRFVSNSSSWVQHLSADGRRIAFTSAREDLVPGDDNGVADTFVLDRADGSVERASVGSTTASAPGALSDSGRFVVFGSGSAEKVRDLEADATYDVPVGSPDRISEDVRYRYAEEWNCFGGKCLFVGYDRYDRVTGDTTLVQSSPASSASTATVTGTDAYATHRPSGETRPVSRPDSGEDPFGAVTTVTISRPGRAVAFASKASNLVAGDTNGTVDVFIRRVAWNWPGQALRSATGPCVTTAGLDTGAAVEVAPGCSPNLGRDITLDSEGKLHVNGGKCLSVGTTTNAARVFLRACRQGEPDQRWRAEPDGTLVNRYSGRCLDVPDTRAGTTLIQWDCHGQANQRWELPPVSGPITGHGGKCVDVSWGAWADGAATQLLACNGTVAQEWTAYGDGTVRALGRCLDTGGGTANGSRVIIWSCHGGPNQQWRAQADGTLRNPRSGRCLDVADFRTDDAAPLQLWDCAASANQRWRLPQAD